MNSFNSSSSEILDSVIKNCIYFVIIGCVSFFTGTGMLALWMYASERMTKRLRESFLESVLRQHVG